MTPFENVLETVTSRDVNKVAALDIGSNSFHLVVARIVAGSVQILHRVKQKVRLAEGLDEDNQLSEEAMQRGLQSLKIVADSLGGFAPDSVRIVATHTLRKARNAREFIEAAAQVLPYPIEVISGTEEARLIYSGVAHTSHIDGKRLVVDIGGGSTELVIGQGFDALLCRSVQVGCVSFSKRFFADGELKAKAFEKAITATEQALELIEEKYRRTGWQQCVGTSGTIRSLANWAQTLPGAGKEQQLTLKDLKLLMRQCIDAGHVSKLDFPGLSDDRRAVIAGGLAIMIGVFQSLQIDTLLYSSAALREGVIYQMEDDLHHADIRGRTAASVATRYDVDTAHANAVLTTCLMLFDEVAKSWKLTHKDYRSMLAWAALLHEVGLQINSRGVQRHSGYILANLDMPGFTQEQQELLATLVRFHRKKIKENEIPLFLQYDGTAIRQLIGLLRLSVLLNIKRQENFIPSLAIETNKSSLTLGFPDGWLAEKPIMSADLEREVNTWKTLGLSLEVKES